MSAIAQSSDRTVSRWHVSPWVDLAAYAFSWVWLFVPLAMAGDNRQDYLVGYIAIVILTDVHRHYGLPYVYLDREIFRRFRLRFTVVPAVMVALWLGAPFWRRHADPLSLYAVGATVAWVIVLAQILRRDRDGIDPPLRPFMVAAGFGAATLMISRALPSSPFSNDPAWGWIAAALVVTTSMDLSALRPQGSDVKPRFIAPMVVGAIAAALLVIADGLTPVDPTTQVGPREMLAFAAVGAGAWNIWHVYMQKYGIFRMYNAKSGRETKVPGWVDRLLVFCWLPFYFAWMGPTHRDTIMKAFADGRKTLTPIIDVMEAWQPYLLPPAVGLVIAAAGLFVVHEWRANRLRNHPRIWMAVGTFALSSTFVFVHPIKAYLAYAFSHALEYMVFVWAFQRRRYAKPLPHRPLLGRLLSHPVTAYFVFTAGLGALFVVLKYWGRYLFPGAARPYFLGIQTYEWVAYWTIFQSVIHFYFDGFLWKMRRRSTRAHI